MHLALRKYQLASHHNFWLWSIKLACSAYTLGTECVQEVKMPNFSLLQRLAAPDANLTSLENKLPKKIKYHYQDPHIVERLSYVFFQHLKNLNADFSRPLVVVSIGTDRSTGDSLGPLVGTKLAALNDRIYIYGSLDNPVHASNLKEKMEEIKEKFRSPLIVAVDACLGQAENVGSISLSLGPIKPGAAVNKNLPEVGDLSFTGTVNVGGYMEYFVLQNTRLSLVWKMADLISKSIDRGYKLAETYFLECLPKTIQ